MTKRRGEVNKIQDVLKSEGLELDLDDVDM